VNEPWYRVKAIIYGAQKKIGLRGTIFKEAEEAQAAYVKGVGIKYGEEKDGDDGLCLDLYFKSESAGMKFATSLRHWNMNRPFFRLDPPPLVDEETCPHPPNLERVLLDHYEPGASDSPCTSLADLEGQRSEAATSVQPESELAKYQALEKPTYLFAIGAKPFRMHLKNRKGHGHPKALAENESNMLAGSWNMHQAIDGLNMRDKKMPTVAVGYARQGDMLETPLGKRRKVIVLVKCRNEEIAAQVQPFLKMGSERKDNTSFEVPVAVKEPNTFKACLEWKFQQTTDLWATQDAELAALEEDDDE
jgi:hypothetical protein